MKHLRVEKSVKIKNPDDWMKYRGSSELLTKVMNILRMRGAKDDSKIYVTVREDFASSRLYIKAEADV